MRILVTGGTGFIGSNLVNALIPAGHDIIITGSDAEQRIPGFQGTYLQPGLTGIDWDRLGAIDILFHQAAINDTTATDETEMMRHNVHDPLILFKKVMQAGCRRIVYASSTAGYGDAPAPYKEDGQMNPLNPYGRSKKLLDEHAMALATEHPGTVIVGLRYCNVYGPGESHKGARASMIRQLALQMLHGDPRVFRDGEHKRDFIYVKDVVEANLLAAKATRSCVVNCGFGKARTFNDIIAILNRTMGLSRTTHYLDNPHAGTYQHHTECDMAQAKARLGFTPRWTLEDGINDYHQTGLLTAGR